MADQSRGFVRALGAATGHVLASLRWLGTRLVAPLRTGDGPNEFRLSSVETHTTTIDGDTGWAHRPPATLRCPECGDEILQADSSAPIDCPRCRVDLPADRFTDLDLLALTCPVCRSGMQYGRRHPEFGVPEWANCPNCQYHWEFKHSY
ncbi:hypothetical protein [Haloplanus sp. C73]|uniref:hypothetical protein n=1 Tax=Haloplanus sp. C73 TaxID=3421641 RepID=UPI003EB966D5